MKIIKIGRSSSNDININDHLVSRAHCQIIQDDDGNFRLIDTNSKNGTYINGTKRHGEVPLNLSDIVRIGNSTLPWQTYFPPVDHPNPVSDPDPEPGPKPNNFLVWAILSTMCCCVPFTIASIVYASKVDGLWYAGKYVEARDAASKARKWFWWAVGGGVLVWIVNIVNIVFCFCIQ